MKQLDHFKTPPIQFHIRIKLKCAVLYTVRMLSLCKLIIFVIDAEKTKVNMPTLFLLFLKNVATPPGHP